jgi:hypothetical protein
MATTKATKKKTTSKASTTKTAKKAPKKPVKKTTSKSPKTKPTKKATTPKAKTKQEERPLLYEEITTRIATCGDNITEEEAKALLGWKEESENIKFGNDYLLKDKHGVKVQCVHNSNKFNTNRPLYKSNYENLEQEFLNNRYTFNGEPIIIGKTGFVLNGQHTLIGFILACQQFDKGSARWSEQGKVRPTLEKLIVFGVDESDIVVNTMDTCKPRSLTDVIYRSAHFAEVPARKRKKISRVLDFAVRTLWYRTGADENAFAPRRTHAESMDFVDRHPKLLNCVKHIMEEDGKEKRISSFISPGTASALMYLMAAHSSSDKYGKTQVPSEADINFDYWDRAEDFWTVLATGGVNSARPALAEIIESGLGGTADERMYLVTTLWHTLVIDGVA